LLIVEGTCGQVACAVGVGVDGAEVLVSERRKSEDVGVDWRIVEWLGLFAMKVLCNTTYVGFRCFLLNTYVGFWCFL
jgi:hypothetical protein